jgi:hypothetical protein
MVLTLKETKNRFRQGTSGRNGRNGPEWQNGRNGRNGRMAGSFHQGTSRCQSSTVMFEIGVSPVRSPTRSYIIECVALHRIANHLYKINHFFPKPDFAKELLLAVSSRFITCKHEQKDKRKVLPLQGRPGGGVWMRWWQRGRVTDAAAAGASTMYALIITIFFSLPTNTLARHCFWDARPFLSI